MEAVVKIVVIEPIEDESKLLDEKTKEKKNQAEDKLLRLTFEKYGNLADEVISELSEEEMDLIEETPVVDSIGTNPREILRKKIYGIVFLLAKGEEKILDKKTKLELYSKRNKKGKEWRDELFLEAKRYCHNNISKTKCLRLAFAYMNRRNKIDDKMKEDFDINFGNIRESFYRFINNETKKTSKIRTNQSKKKNP